MARIKTLCGGALPVGRRANHAAASSSIQIGLVQARRPAASTATIRNHFGEFAEACWRAPTTSNATEVTRVAFRQINKKTGNRLRQQLVDDETREPVEAHEKGRGYEYAKGSYLMIEDHELDAIEIESNRTIEIDTFVPRAEIDERFLDSPYYIGRTSPSARRLSRASRRRCAARTWSHWVASCCRSASA